MNAFSRSPHRGYGFRPTTIRAVRLFSRRSAQFVFALTAGIGLSLSVSLVGRSLAAERSADDTPQQADARDTITIELMEPSAPGESARFAVILPAAEVKSLRASDATSRDWTEILAITVVRDSESDPLPMLGTYSIKDHRLLFVPRFPLRPGMTYRATFRAPDGGTPGTKSLVLVREFVLAKPKPSQPTVVEEVYPTRDVLPENQLKFYIHFSGPMSRGEAYQRIRLIQAPGTQIEDPFLELGEELWNRDGTRFTLFFDPGRIKRGLKPREEVGPALEEGHRYTLEIDAGWRDADGQALATSYRKAFRVAAPDDTQPQPSRWRFERPSAASQDPLTVRLDEPLDHAMLHRVLSIADSTGRSLEGEIAVSGEETIWRFMPKRPWSAGSYNLVVETTLEDLAGNSLARPFEIDVFRPLPKSRAQAQATIPFQIEPAPTSSR